PPRAAVRSEDAPWIRRRARTSTTSAWRRRASAWAGPSSTPPNAARTRSSIRTERAHTGDVPQPALEAEGVDVGVVRPDVDEPVRERRRRRHPARAEVGRPEGGARARIERVEAAVHGPDDNRGAVGCGRVGDLSPRRCEPDGRARGALERVEPVRRPDED